MELFGGDISLLTLIFIVVGGLLSGFVDSIAGGGGLISLPVLLTAGLPVHYALGTNKFAASFGSVMSAFQFMRANKVDFHLVKKLLPFTFLGSAAGAALMIHMSSALLQPIIIFALVAVAIFVIVKGDWGTTSTYNGETRRTLYMWFATAFIIGAYDGFVGPGTGTFLIIAFVMTGFDFVLAAGNAKMLNMMSNLTAFCLMIYWGNVLYLYGIALAISIFTGAYFGSRLAIKRGSRFVRIVLIVVTVSLIGKLLLNYLGVL